MTSIVRHGELSQHVDLSEHGELSHHGDFDPEQAAMLQDLARSGAPEAQMYGFHEVTGNGTQMNGYGDGASNDMQSNGVLPVFGIAHHASFTYPQAGLLQSQQDLDLDDPAALLESLANFEHPPPNSNAPISNDHFASLLQAAATAGGQEAAQGDLGRTRRSTRQSRTGEQFDIVQDYTRESRSRRKQDNPNVTEMHEYVTRGTKRKRAVDEIDEAEQLAREREIWGPEEPDEEEDSADESPYAHREVGTADARLAGVHSAAALFRRPSSASKKYTRPPMSKLFTSLELTPEQFLHLQAAAKVYMLDPDHPERRDCVGNRGRGDTDMVKLKLFGCVKSFLEDEGWGERCFGPSADGADVRKLRWPQMKNKVISLVTPLLRRMVTNERQRQYAIETRKTTPKSSNTKGTTKKANDSQPAASTRERAQTSLRENDQPARYPHIDPKLDQYHYNLDPSFTAPTSTTTPSPQTPTPKLQKLNSSPPEPEEAFQPPDSTLNYHLNILHNGVRIRPKAVLSPSSCPGLTSLIQHAHGVLGDEHGKIARVQVLGADGLRDIEDEEAWTEVLRGVLENEWMDGEVRVVVEVGYAE